MSDIAMITELASSIGVPIAAWWYAEEQYPELPYVTPKEHYKYDLMKRVVLLDPMLELMPDLHLIPREWVSRVESLDEYRMRELAGDHLFIPFRTVKNITSRRITLL